MSDLRERLSEDQIECFRVALRNWTSRENSTVQARRDALCDMALASLPSAIGDMVLVPRNPTPEMSAAGFCVSEAEHDPAGVYRAMLAAAPSPRVEVGDTRDAARYRWICDDHHPSSEAFGARQRLLLRAEMMGKGAIDAAIDAAMLPRGDSRP